MVLMANASKDSLKAFHNLLANHRITPIYVQYVLGRKVWTIETLKALPRINHCDIPSIPETMTHYVMFTSRKLSWSVFIGYLRWY